MSALDIDNISHSYGDREVVHGLSLAVAPGSIVCLLGPSGCGKTTVLRLVAGLETLRHGRIAIEGRTVAGDGVTIPPEGRRVGLMFQDFALFPHLSVIDNVQFGLGDIPATGRRAIAERALDQVGLAHAARAFPHTLSGGEQQRVALARALAPRPNVLLLDEPFSELDVRLREGLRRRTADLLNDAGITTLLVTHDPEEAMLMADQIALMRNGRIEQIGRPVDLYRAPISPFCAEFLGETNRIEGCVENSQVRTPLATLDANGHAEGTRVVILIRPEGLRISRDNGVRAVVVGARSVGPSTLVRVRLAPIDGQQDLELVARLPIYEALAPNSELRLRLDRAMAFVFPAADR